jgi:hypothetical protein
MRVIGKIEAIGCYRKILRREAREKQNLPKDEPAVESNGGVGPEAT